MNAKELAALADRQAITITAAAQSVGCSDTALIDAAAKEARKEMDQLLARVALLNGDTPEDSVPNAYRKRRRSRPQVRAKIWGHSASAVLRWMGANGWTFEDAACVLADFGAGRMSDANIAMQLRFGRTSERPELKVADISPSEAKRLRDLAS